MKESTAGAAFERLCYRGFQAPVASAPNLDSAIVTACGKKLINWIKGNTLHKPMVSSNGADPVEGVTGGPDHDEGVKSDGCKICICLAPCNIGDVGGVSRESAARAPIFDVGLRTETSAHGS